ncbi:hypothetical protein DXG01_000898, partial [Tephrocybe rancida]
YPVRYIPQADEKTGPSKAQIKKEVLKAMEDPDMSDGMIMVDALIKSLNWDCYMDSGEYVDYLFEGGDGWMDPGPVVDMTKALSQFNTNSTDPFKEHRTRARGNYKHKTVDRD